MRFALAAGACLLAIVATVPGAQNQVSAQDRQSAKSVREHLRSRENARSSMNENFRSRMNENVVTIMAGSPSGTDLAIVQDIAAVLDEGDDLRVLPMVGKGPAQNVKDVLFLRGVDMGITQANVLKHFARTGELGPIVNQIAYVAKLFNEEMHVLVRSDVKDIHELAGKPVNFGLPGSGTEITSRLVFEALGINVLEKHLNEPDAIQKLRSGEIAASIVVTGKPAPVLADLKDTNGLKLLPVPYAKQLEDSYYPGTLTHDDYPALVAKGQTVDTVSVCAVLVSFNWTDNGSRYQKLSKFVDRFFNKFGELMKSPRHPKWQEVNFAATLENWNRAPQAQQWIDHAADVADSSTRERFDTFLAQAKAGNAARVSDADRADLFRAFLEWSKNQNKN
jgi:TRAP transporter TAXI family solute receptor